MTIFYSLNWKFISRRDLRIWKTLKEIQWHKFTPYQKRNFRGALTNGKLTGISVFNSRRDYFKENISFFVRLYFGKQSCYITYDMDFRFIPSDPVCLASYHILISKQGRMIRALRSNRCVTGMRSRDENHAVRFRQSAENRVECGTRSQTEVSLTSLQGGTSIGTPWLLKEDMGRRSPLSEYMSLHPSLTHHRNINPFENKVWEIYFYKEVCWFVHWSS